LDVTTTMGRLSAAGIGFNTQPSPAAVAAALDLAAQMQAALVPFHYKRMRWSDQQYHQRLRQERQQAPMPLLLPQLYLCPLQQGQEVHLRKTFQAFKGADSGEQMDDIISVSAGEALQAPQQFWSLGAPVTFVYGSLLLRHWEQQLQQQLQPQGVVVGDCAAPVPVHAVAGGGASCGGSSSSSRPACQEAEGLLLLGAAAMEGPIRQQQQQLQQQLALCRQYQQQFQQAAANLGLSSELMAAVAAWFTGAELCSSSSSTSTSSSEGAAAGSDAAVHCLSVVCTASLLFMLLGSLGPPAAGQKSSHQFTPAEIGHISDFFLQV
jgi:hypothetical protein